MIFVDLDKFNSELKSSGLVFLWVKLRVKRIELEFIDHFKYEIHYIYSLTENISFEKDSSE